MSEQVILILTAFFAAGSGLMGWFTIHYHKHTFFCCLVAAIAVVSAGFAIAMFATPGWDALIYAILLILGSLPAATALFLGGGIGMLTRFKLLIPS